VYGSGLEQLTSNDNRLLTVTVPALSTVVYESAKQIPRSDAAPQISLEKPVVSAKDNSRMLVSAIVGGSSFNEVTFYAKVGNDTWKSVGTDDTRPYRVFHDVSSIPDGKHVIYRAVVRDNAGHQRLSGPRKAVVPAPS
jgi:alpha-amylase